MYLFHGTSTKAVDSILKAGLVPANPEYRQDGWQQELTGRGHSSHIYTSTGPIAGKGGDPLAFARGWPLADLRLDSPDRGVIIVLDLPPEHVNSITRAVIRNIDLDAYYDMLRTVSFLGHEQNWYSLLWFALRLGPGITRSEVVKRLEPIFINVDKQARVPSVRSWKGFVEDYLRLCEVRRGDFKSITAFDGEREKIKRRYGIVFPEWLEEDDYGRTSFFTVQSIVQYAYRLPELGPLPPDTDQEENWFHLKGFPGREFERYFMGRLGILLRMASLWVESYKFEELEQGVRKLNHETGWQSFRKQFPVDEARLPPVWRQDFGKSYDPALLRQKDVQLLTDKIAPEYILGVIEVSDERGRLMPYVRPGKSGSGTTFESRIWKLVHEMKKSYKGKPVRVDAEGVWR